MVLSISVFSLRVVKPLQISKLLQSFIISWFFLSNQDLQSQKCKRFVTALVLLSLKHLRLGNKAGTRVIPARIFWLNHRVFFEYRFRFHQNINILGTLVCKRVFQIFTRKFSFKIVEGFVLFFLHPPV